MSENINRLQKRLEGFEGLEILGEPADEAWKERKLLSLVKVLSESDSDVDKETLVFAERALQELKRKWDRESSGAINGTL
ncbi:MAG: hypothetical protein LBC41_03995 [Clostridiales bacterium]|jgi:hypothetical protein|nr:hypothetical protein [Clostridiales bacterium]MDR2749803.1 hypothetical protein [Clostridiales bacterium]